ncbi:enoyl-CoA hydratase/isomerase family protein [Rhizobium halophytocola]|uniref:3-hydroxyisobutyryl-CoA hydrolase n=1 Tax=Rhizobium halophytocola TaxID=735519 RepID=A0ABS4DU01_9HYPH|nr:enoyl-CoA hydratase/isomerase family protein [Rhizobium halophytocola]MBP1849094.1 enoyl-CoA hydratase [Rhizobium halophytocola]
MSNEPQLLVDRDGALGVISLNRPEALNSLNRAMVGAMQGALDRFEADPAIAAVLVKGAGERGLCAGGDIRMVHKSGRAGDGQGLAFWREEYRMNVHIARYSKPYIAFMDGIVMGGGVGISAHGSHRIVTERLKLAMPETGIGFFPDVGASFLLPRSPGELGTYLGLTGEIIGAADAILAGLADVCVPVAQLPALQDALATLSPAADAELVGDVVAAFATDPGPAPLESHLPLIDRCFAGDTVEEIVEALNGETDVFAGRTVERLWQRSPTALKITLRMLRLGRQSQTLEECIDREFAGSAAILTLDDFYEGVRAAVIDKDRNPTWRPGRIEDVTAAEIIRFFKPHPDPPIGAAGR